MKEKIITRIIFLTPLVLSIIVGAVFSLGSGFLLFGMFNVGLYVHTTTTTLSNALLGKMVDPVVDVVWKFIYLFCACVCLTFYLYLH